MATGNEESERSCLLHPAADILDHNKLHNVNASVNVINAVSSGHGCFQTRCPFQDLSVETNSVSILQAAVFVEDAINYRSIHHKIDPVTLSMFYRPYYTRIVQYSINVFIAIYLLLAFFEKPSSLTINSDYRDRSNKTNLDPPCGVTESIEFLCLVIFAIDALVQFKLIGRRRYIRRPWLVLYSILILASVIDLFVSVGMLCEYGTRVRRLLRPVFLLQRSSIMKKMVNAIKKSLPQIISVLVLLLLVLYVFAMVGLLLFHKKSLRHHEDSSLNNKTTNVSLGEGHEDPHENYTAEELEGHLYFSSLREAFVSLLVLLTTANNPDSMLPVYTANRFYAIYFIVFVALSTYIMLNLLTAVIYNQFRGYLGKSLQSSFFRRRVGLRAAFIILSVRKRDPRNGLELEIIHVDTVRRLLHNVRMKKKYLPLMFNMLETMDTNYFSWIQFRTLFDILGKKTKKHSTEDDEQLSHRRWYARFQLAVRHKYSMYFTHFVSMVHAIFITVELERAHDYDENLARRDSTLMVGNFWFIIYYLLELIIKIFALGIKGYLKQLGNIYEGLITLVLLSLMIVYIVMFGSPTDDETSAHLNSEEDKLTELNRVIRVITIFVILRLLRIVPHIQRLYMVFITVIDLISHLRGFMGIIVAVYYFFAILGMQLFSNKYKLETISSSQCTDQEIDVKNCTQYQQLEYYANNFHDFGAALVVLWDVMVVNNWYIFLDGYKWMTTSWAQLYFIAWWLVSVIVCVNLFVALVLEAFVSRWEHVQRQESAELYSSTHMNTMSYDSYNYQQRDDVQAVLHEQLVEPQEADIMHELQKHRDMILYANF